MSYNRQRERENFLNRMYQEGVPLDVSRLVMKHAASLQTIAERECSDESADRDRVKCPGIKIEADCICEFGYGVDASGCREKVCVCHDGRGHRNDTCAHCGCRPGHATVPRITVRGAYLEARVAEILKPYSVEPIFNGDPRGAVVKLKVPSGKTDDWGREGICVP